MMEEYLRITEIRFTDSEENPINLKKANIDFEINHKGSIIYSANIIDKKTDVYIPLLCKELSEIGVKLIYNKNSKEIQTGKYLNVFIKTEPVCLKNIKNNEIS